MITDGVLLFPPVVYEPSDPVFGVGPDSMFRLLAEMFPPRVELG